MFNKMNRYVCDVYEKGSYEEVLRLEGRFQQCIDMGYLTEDEINELDPIIVKLRLAYKGALEYYYMNIISEKVKYKFMEVAEYLRLKGFKVSKNWYCNLKE